jgi:hypothetical protein
MEIDDVGRVVLIGAYPAAACPVCKRCALIHTEEQVIDAFMALDRVLDDAPLASLMTGVPGANF